MERISLRAKQRGGTSEAHLQPPGHRERWTIRTPAELSYTLPGTITSRGKQKMKFNEIRDAVKKGVSCLDFLEKAPKGGYVCPICGSGKGPHKTGGCKYYPETNTWACHACSADNGKKTGGDVISLYRAVTGRGYTEALRDLGERIGLSIDAPRAATSDEKSSVKGNTSAEGKDATTAPSRQREAEKDFSAYYEQCLDRLASEDGLPGIDYLEGRGISLTTACNFQIGYDPVADPAGAGHPAPRLIIPTSKGHYVARAISPDTPPEFQKMNPKGSRPGIFHH